MLGGVGSTLLGIIKIAIITISYDIVLGHFTRSVFAFRLRGISTGIGIIRGLVVIGRGYVLGIIVTTVIVLIAVIITRDVIVWVCVISIICVTLAIRIIVTVVIRGVIAIAARCVVIIIVVIVIVTVVDGYSWSPLKSKGTSHNQRLSLHFRHGFNMGYDGIGHWYQHPLVG